MKIAITGGSGFVGRHVAAALGRDGHDVVLVARGIDEQAPEPQMVFVRTSVEDEDALVDAFSGCSAVVHCAGINRELGAQTYEAVHVLGTRSVVSAAKRAGVGRVAVLSYLRARPDCGSGYLESKWKAEEIVRHSGLEYLVVKSAMIFGRGDHMVDHTTKAIKTFRMFVRVGLSDRAVRPVAIDDIVRILRSFAVDRQLLNKTVAVVGPEEMPLAEAAKRVARTLGVRAPTLPMPIWALYALAWVAERLMKVPLVAIAQVRLLREGPESGLLARPLPSHLAPATRFVEREIRAALPDRLRYGVQDLRCAR